MTLKTDHVEVFEGEGIGEVEVNCKGGICQQQELREGLEAFFHGVESKRQVGGMMVGYLVESLQQHLHLSEEDAEHIVHLLGGDLSAHIKKEVFVECALGWWENKGSAGEDEVIEDVGEEILEEARFQNIPVGSSIGRSSMENLEDLHFLEEKKEELEERLRLSVELEEKWRRQYFVKAAQCELEETRFWYLMKLLESSVHCFPIIAP